MIIREQIQDLTTELPLKITNKKIIHLYTYSIIRKINVFKVIF